MHLRCFHKAVAVGACVPFLLTVLTRSRSQEVVTVVVVAGIAIAAVAVAAAATAATAAAGICGDFPGGDKSFDQFAPFMSWPRQVSLCNSGGVMS